MTCQEINELLDKRLIAAGAALPLGVIEHLERCEGCRRLVRFLCPDSQPPEPAIPPETYERMTQCLKNSLRPVRPAPGTGLFAAAFLGITGLLVVLTVLMHGAPGVEAMGWRSALVVGFTLAAGLFVVAVSLSRQLLPGTRHRIPPRLACVGALGLFGFGVALSMPWKAGNGTTAGWSCASHELLLSVLVAAILLILLRRGFALAPERLGATAGALAGLAGAVVVHFQCTTPEAPHVLIWHLAVAALCALAGALIGRLWRLRPRARTA